MMNTTKVRAAVPNPERTESPDEYQRRLVSEAQLFYSFVLGHSNLSTKRAHRLSTGALGFTFRHRASTLAYPSKLSGTRMLQDSLEALVSIKPEPWHRLDLLPAEGRIEAYYEGLNVGHLWPGHVWAWPLLTAGMEARMIRITGAEEAWKFYGMNVVLTGLAESIRRMTERPPIPCADVKHPDFISGPDTNGTSRS